MMNRIMRDDAASNIVQKNSSVPEDPTKNALIDLRGSAWARVGSGFLLVVDLPYPLQLRLPGPARYNYVGVRICPLISLA